MTYSRPGPSTVAAHAKELADMVGRNTEQEVFVGLLVRVARDALPDAEVLHGGFAAGNADDITQCHIRLVAFPVTGREEVGLSRYVEQQARDFLVACGCGIRQIAVHILDDYIT